MTVEIVCDCDIEDRYYLRVTGGTLDGSHESTYACDDCAPLHAANIGRRFTNVEIVELPTRFRCPICAAVMKAQADVNYGYCPTCRAFTRTCTIGGCTDTPTTVAGNVAVCAGHAAELHLPVEETTS